MFRAASSCRWAHCGTTQFAGQIYPALRVSLIAHKSHNSACLKADDSILLGGGKESQAHPYIDTHDCQATKSVQSSCTRCARLAAEPARAAEAAPSLPPVESQHALEPSNSATAFSWLISCCPASSAWRAVRAAGLLAAVSCRGLALTTRRVEGGQHDHDGWIQIRWVSGRWVSCPLHVPMKHSLVRRLHELQTVSSPAAYPSQALRVNMHRRRM